MYNHASYICLIFRHHVCSFMFSNVLPENINIHTDCIEYTFLKKKKKKGCSSGTVRLCLHFLALLGWVSCNEEVAIASAHYNLIQKKPNQQHHFTITWLPFAELVLICIVYPLTNNPVNPRIGATLIHCKYRKSIQLKKEWHEREISQWSAISGNSRTALIEHYHSPLLHCAWNYTHCVGIVCDDRAP